MVDRKKGVSAKNGEKKDNISKQTEQWAHVF